MKNRTFILYHIRYVSTRAPAYLAWAIPWIHLASIWAGWKFSQSYHRTAQYNISQDLWNCWQSLSPREQEVTALVCLGYTNGEIASKLKVSPTTIKSHVRNILPNFKCTVRLNCALPWGNGILRNGINPLSLGSLFKSPQIWLPLRVTPFSPPTILPWRIVFIYRPDYPVCLWTNFLRRK